MKKPVSKKPVPKKPVTKKPVTKKLVPKKTGKAIPSSKKSKMAKVIQNHSSSSSNSSSSSSSNSSSSSSDSNDDSSDEEEVVDRVGIDIKPKKSIVRRGKSTTLLANMKSQPPQPTPRKGKGKKMNAVKFISSEEEDSDEELIVDDLDDLLETMSPLSEHSSNESVLQSEEEFFTDDDETMSPTSYGSSIHIDSGDDEDIENTETQKIINELTLDSDEEESDMDQVVFAQDDEGGVFVEDDDEEDDIEEDDDDDEEHIPNFYYNRHQSHWSSSSEDEEEDEEFDYTTIPEEEEEEEEDSNALLPLLDSEGNLYDSIAAAFMQAFSMNADTTTTTTAQHSGTNTPAAVTLGEDYQLSPFELANALTALSAAEHVFMRRPSLPSSAVSAAQRMRGSQDLSTSDLRAIVSDDLTLSLEPIQESTEEQSSPTTNDNQLFSNDIKLQEQILDILKNSQKEDQKEDSIQDEQQQEEEKVLQPIITNNSTRQILPKPSGSGDSYFPNMLSQTALEQHIQDVLTQSIESSHQSQKRKSTMNETIEKKKLRRSSNIQPMPSSFSTPASPAAIVDEEEEEEEEAVSMDDLVDTSQLYTRSLSRSPSPDISEDDNPYSRDLSRWQRIPIGAFRLMRSKNKLWLER